MKRHVKIKMQTAVQTAFPMPVFLRQPPKGPSGFPGVSYDPAKPLPESEFGQFGFWRGGLRDVAEAALPFTEMAQQLGPTTLASFHPLPELAEQTPEIAMSAKTLSVMVASLQASTASSIGLYRLIVAYIHAAQVPTALASTVLRAMGISRARASEINRIAQNTDEVVTKYLDGTSSFHVALREARVALPATTATGTMTDSGDGSTQQPSDIPCEQDAVSQRDSLGPQSEMAPMSTQVLPSSRLDELGSVAVKRTEESDPLLVGDPRLTLPSGDPLVVEGDTFHALLVRAPDKDGTPGASLSYAYHGANLKRVRLVIDVPFHAIDGRSVDVKFQALGFTINGSLSAAI